MLASRDLFPTSAPDARLVALVAAGHREALGALYARHVARLLTEARRCGLGASDAEDLVHDVFIEAWRRAHQFEESRGTVTLWLMVRLRSRAKDYWTRPWVARRSELSAAPIRRAPRLDTIHVWEETVRPLSPEQRGIFERLYRDGMTLPEVAASAGLPVGTIKSRLARGLATLRAAADGEHDNQFDLDLGGPALCR